MKSAIRGLSAALLFGMMSVGCQSSHQDGVTSDYRSQWIAVAADTETVTQAAADVFKENNLSNVSMKSTKVDGEASGDKADGTKIRASVGKTDAGSKLYVTVGTVGDPKMGADLAMKIKQVAEKKTM